MGVRGQIRDSEFYQPPESQTVAAAKQTAEATGSSGSGPEVGPLISWEKTDVEFWLQVAQVVLLFLILRDVGGVR